jgi:mono/diheme cytochrome c family protein
MLFTLLAVLSSCRDTKKPVKAVSEPGLADYNKYCLACHQADGSGVPGMYPPLGATDWVQGDKSRLIELVLNGQQGIIEVNGVVYKGSMPSHQYLTDEQVAAILTYVRSHFGNQADPVSTDEVARVRSQGPPK